MAHIFISYSHRDHEYATRLYQHLTEQGFDSWIDHRLDYGSQWPLEIQSQLDGCDAFIIILSQNSYQSEWVQSELQRAKRKAKPIFPLLLAGDEPWLSLESTQFYDVRDGGLPDARFFSALKKALSTTGSARTVKITKDALPSHKPAKQARANENTRTGWVVLAILVTLLGCAGCLGLGIWYLTNAINMNVEDVINDLGTETVGEDEPFTGSTGDQDLATPEPVFAGEMIFISEGEFIMGSEDGQLHEQPVHTVYLNDYWIDQYEVTNAQYDECVEQGDCQAPHFDGEDFSYDPGSANYPVVYVSWEMAQTYCEWRDARLPTEAEWEKAARGADGLTYPWGDGFDCELANYNACSFDELLQPVGSFPKGASPYGVMEMAGNVSEWVADIYSDDYYASSPDENPTGPEQGRLRVVRGGSWYYDASFMTTTYRTGFNPSETFGDLGFRCATSSD